MDAEVVVIFGVWTRDIRIVVVVPILLLVVDGGIRGAGCF